MEKTKKPYKTFKEYYADPEFKKRHLKYVVEKIQCPDCGKMISRANMTKHKRTSKHVKIDRVELMKLQIDNFTDDEKQQLKNLI